MSDLLTQIENADKQTFIDLARQVNVLKTKKEPHYLLVKDKILELLPKHNLTIDDILPLPRVGITGISTSLFNKNNK